jgi:hypothetical protein
MWNFFACVGIAGCVVVVLAFAVYVWWIATWGGGRFGK